jgi:hypothetical protein
MVRLLRNLVTFTRFFHLLFLIFAAKLGVAAFFLGPKVRGALSAAEDETQESSVEGE